MALQQPVPRTLQVNIPRKLGRVGSVENLNRAKRFVPQVVNIKQQQQKMAKISSQLQENIFQSRLKPGLTASRMSLKHLSKFRDKLNYENEDYERKLMMDKNSHYDQNF